MSCKRDNGKRGWSNLMLFARGTLLCLLPAAAGQEVELELAMARQLIQQPLLLLQALGVVRGA